MFSDPLDESFFREHVEGPSAVTVDETGKSLHDRLAADIQLADWMAQERRCTHTHKRTSKRQAQQLLQEH